MEAAIRWMSRNHVASNLLMAVLVVGGVIMGLGIKQEVFPEVELDRVSVTVAYPGAGPEEVEEGILLKIEDSLTGVDGIDEITATALEGRGTVVAEVRIGEDVNLVLQDIKSEIDRIDTFPDDSETPVVASVLNVRSVGSIVVYGDTSERTLREQAEQIREDLLALPDITQVTLSGVRPYEIAIDISEENLRRYGMTLDQVAAMVRRASLDLPGGNIKTGSGEILLRTKERRYTADEYAGIIIRAAADGARVRLGDIATIREGFEDTDIQATFDGKPAAMVNVYRVGDQKPTGIAKKMRQYVAAKNKSLPDTLETAVWNDRSEILQSRINLLSKNAAMGLILVITILGLFLEIRLALWVMLGIPISFFGAMLFLPSLGVSINMISLFAFILVLGILVDDAIVVGESIFEHRQRGKPYAEAAVDGVLEVSMPVVFSILTTVAAFMPLAFVSGTMGKFIIVIPMAVITLLLVSLVESLFILPAHLSGGYRRDQERGLFRLLQRIRRWLTRHLDRLIDGPYARVLNWALRYRYATVACGIALLMISVGLFKGGVLKFQFMPKVDGDVITANIQMPPGTPVARTQAVVDHLIVSAMDTVTAIDEDREDQPTVFRHIFAITGMHMSSRGPRGGGNTASGSHLASVALLLTKSEDRELPAAMVDRRWRAAVGEIPGVESLVFSFNLMRVGANIDIQMAHTDFAVLSEVSESIKATLANYPGLNDIEDTYEQGKSELKLRLRDEARTLGITETDLARQVRAAFYGAEALSLQIGRNEVKVMVRYPEEDRQHLWNLANMRIRTPAGGEIPLIQAAVVEQGQGYSTISRNNRKRVINVTASVDAQRANAGDILAELQTDLFPQLLQDYPGLVFDLAGEQKEQKKSIKSMAEGFGLALLVIYALMAIPFRSYAQPLLIMAAIPFGFVGAVIGHLIMGYQLSILSIFGLVALSGVVVNDSLLLINAANTNRREGKGLVDSVIAACRRRFRPILLTSLTTFFGLMPMILETSVQARFLIPMAISLGFGILFATGIILLLVPSLYLVLEDVLCLCRRRPNDDSEVAVAGLAE